MHTSWLISLRVLEVVEPNEGEGIILILEITLGGSLLPSSLYNEGIVSSLNRAWSNIEHRDSKLRAWNEAKSKELFFRLANLVVAKESTSMQALMHTLSRNLLTLRQGMMSQQQPQL